MNEEEKKNQEEIEKEEKEESIVTQQKQEDTIASTAEERNGPNLDLILDIPLEVTVEMGKTKILVKDLL